MFQALCMKGDFTVVNYFKVEFTPAIYFEMT